MYPARSVAAPQTIFPSTRFHSICSISTQVCICEEWTHEERLEREHPCRSLEIDEQIHLYFTDAVTLLSQTEVTKVTPDLVKDYLERKENKEDVHCNLFDRWIRRWEEKNIVRCPGCQIQHPSQAQHSCCKLVEHEFLQELDTYAAPGEMGEVVKELENLIMTPLLIRVLGKTTFDAFYTQEF
ncbi:hypothetical protein PoB_006495300 [Plakobranchus ocellatus]|uniref:Uncharacterized protein n=1 Tax=Plakobranchus ocellatus TaxID=259542 RepID=A0AAV4D2T5_9GAST|nr:hypothetical protein PoB_006495300 [Plakobranchus ocellatus]